MSKVLHALYDRLPIPFRSLAASLHGYQLRSWRYGRETERLVEQALAREGWSHLQWKAWQSDRLNFILERAVTKVPYYRDLWARRRQSGDPRSWKLFEHWPILEKETVRDNPRAFIADDCNPKRMFHENTSGTTGKAIDLWFNRTTIRAHYALVEARWRRWYGISHNDRWAILGGRIVVPSSQRHPPFWVWNHAMHQLYMSSFHLAPDLLPHYWHALKEHKIKYILGYSSALFTLAQGALQQGLSGLSLEVVITNSEPLYDYQRETIAQAFDCPVRETYGMCELTAAAGECEFGRLHAWPESSIVEILDGNAPVPPGCSGQLVCTGLLNPDMPLIRYKVGDYAVQGDSTAPCPCGRNLPWFEKIEGRLCDIVFTPDKRRIGRLDSVFLPRLPIREAQIEQITLDCLRVRYVPAPGFDTKSARTVIERLRTRLGDVEVLMEQVAAIPRGANGKFRALICSLPPNQKQELMETPLSSRPTHKGQMRSAILETSEERR